MNKSEPDEYSGKWWCAEIARTEKELNSQWRTSALKVVDRYLDIRETSRTDVTCKYNIFWANVQILKSALYATAPAPTVTRQYGDASDDVARTAALMLERILTFGINRDESDMHQAFKAAVEDRLIPGMGQVWLRYEAETEAYEVPAVIDPMTGMELSPASEGERIVAELAPADYVHWGDFIWSPARTWEEVWWVARRVWMRKKQFCARFGEDKYKELASEASLAQKTEGKMPKGFKKGRVELFEVWCKESRKVYWCSTSLEECLDEMDDPLQLDEFFPCPRPLFATHSTGDLTPRPDFVMCQDQYDELDVLNDRISQLTRALRLVGVFDESMGQLKSLLTGPEFAMVPVSNWAMFSEKGGMKGAVDWFPVEQIAGVLEKLMLQRGAVIGQIYELTSISDIMRGSSNPRETAKAQSLKAQYSSVRLQLTQQDVGVFIRHAMRIKAEIVSKHFQPMSIIEQSQIQYTNSAQYAQSAVELLKSYQASQYRIEVSEESLSIADYTAEREMRMNYVTVVGQFISQTAQMSAQMPQALPYILRILQWATAAFQGSSDIESVFDEAVAAASQPQPQPPQQQEAPPPDNSLEVAQIKAQADLQMAREDNQTKLQIAQMQMQKDMESQQMKGSQEMAGKQMDAAEARQSEGDMVEILRKLLAPLEEKIAQLSKQETETEMEDD